MKLRRMLVFTAVIVSLALVALAAPGVKTFNLKFKGEGYFDVQMDATEWVFRPFGGPDLLNVSHLGISEVDYELHVTPPTGDPEDPGFDFISGTFTITGANGDSLTGSYSDFKMGTGTYTLEWLFEDGTGRFEDAHSPEGTTGHTDGLVDLTSGFAQFEFSGKIIVPKQKRKN